jgi:hypothetical protein
MESHQDLPPDPHGRDVLRAPQDSLVNGEPLSLDGGGPETQYDPEQTIDGGKP